MNSTEKNNVPPGRPRVLVAPLDWGLGHATRCIPLIRALQKAGSEVLLAAEGDMAKLLDNEFPGIRILPLPGYRIRYARKEFLFTWKLLWQIPRIWKAMKNEKALLARWVQSEMIDAVISDNRPGMFHHSVPCVYITHQLHIETGSRLSTRYFSRLHRRLMGSFDECWVPDVEEGKGLSGKLSHPRLLPDIPVKYIGPLSRFKKSPAAIQYDLLILLSGPEPQRTIFENIMLSQASALNMRIALLRGLPGNNPIPSHPSHITIINHMPAEKLNELICASSDIVARGGYSTIMDLTALGKRAILVPTPGQTEQEYISSHVEKEHLFLTVSQKNIQLTRDLERMQSMQYSTFPFHSDPDAVINDWMKRKGLIR